MRRPGRLLVALLALTLALAPAVAMAAAGSGGSYGSRGMRTYSAPPPTRTSPYGATPMQRSLTPQPAPSYGYRSPGSGYGYGSRSPFMSGLLGGLIGAGIGGLLFGHGLFGGITGFGSFLGLLLQIFLIVWAVRWVMRRVFGQPSYAGPPGYARGALPPGSVPSGSVPNAGGAGAPARGLAIGPPDYQAFERLLRAVQDAWSAQDLNRMRQMATPEMVGVFAEQLAEQSSRGVRNIVSDVRLEQGDLAEAWSEGDRDYATVVMRFAMHDATQDRAGRIIDGSVTEWVSTVEYWTFMRARGGQWLLSAIQQQAR